MKKLFIHILFLLATIAAIPTAHTSAAPIKVFVSLLPQAYFVERIGGQFVTVDALVGPGQSPHTYEPTPKQMARLAQADVFFRTGIGFEDRLMQKIADTLPQMKIVDLRRGIAMLPMEEHEGEGEESGHAHRHGEYDPHIWLDPNRVKIQAQTIADELSRLAPAHARDFRNNLASFQADLDRTDAEIKRMLAPFRGKAFMVFHPSYGYFADAYGLRQLAVEEGGRSPGPRQIARWVEYAKKNNVRIVFVQPQFSAGAAQAIADAIGGRVAPMDPLSKDYLINLKKMAQEIAAALR